MQKQYFLVVRDEIATSKVKTDETLKALDCYYQSPEFLSDRTQESLNAVIEKYQQDFKHFINWTAELVEV